MIKAGVLDELEEEEEEEEDNGAGAGGEGAGAPNKGLLILEQVAKPLLELFVRNRPFWLAAVEGAFQDVDGSVQKTA